MGTTFFGSDNGQVWQCITTAGGVRQFIFRFDRLKEIVSGQQLDWSPVVTAAPTGSGMAIEDVETMADRTSVIATLSEPVAGIVYRLRCRCGTTGGAILDVYGDLKVI